MRTDRKSVREANFSERSADERNVNDEREQSALAGRVWSKNQVRRGERKRKCEKGWRTFIASVCVCVFGYFKTTTTIKLIIKTTTMMMIMMKYVLWACVCVIKDRPMNGKWCGKDGRADRRRRMSDDVAWPRRYQTPYEMTKRPDAIERPQLELALG